MKKWTWIIITPDGSISGTNDEDTARDMNEEAAVLTTQDDGSIVQLDSDFDPQEIPEI